MNNLNYSKKLSLKNSNVYFEIKDDKIEMLLEHGEDTCAYVSGVDELNLVLKEIKTLLKEYKQIKTKQNTDKKQKQKWTENDYLDIIKMRQEKIIYKVIAEKYSVSTERIRQIIKKGNILKRINKPWK